MNLSKRFMKLPEATVVRMVKPISAVDYDRESYGPQSCRICGNAAQRVFYGDGFQQVFDHDANQFVDRDAVHIVEFFCRKHEPEGSA